MGDDNDDTGRPLVELESGLANPDSWRIYSSKFPRHDQPGEESPTSVDRCLKLLGIESESERYYQQQEEVLDGFSEMDKITDRGFRPSTTQEERANIRKGEQFAIQISNVANMALFALKVYASVRSGSLAIIASTLDSLLDLLSGFILWFTAVSMRRPNPYLYPIGKKRMQPLGILVFASVMATLGLLIIYESMKALIAQDRTLDLAGPKRDWVVGIMVGASVVKLLLMLYCRTFTNEIVSAYALDHFFDVVTNVIGLVAAILATQISWWIDPVGAIVINRCLCSKVSGEGARKIAALLALSCFRWTLMLQLAIYTIRTWSMAVLENVNLLVSKTASPDFLQKLTYLCWNHHKEIRQIDTVRAYTFGSHYFAEVDIVLPADMPLKLAHDIGESLQIKLESLPDIERAFVHLDYEASHRPEHEVHDYK